MKTEVNYSRWNREARVLLAFSLLWFVHGGLMSVNRVFALTWVAHALIAGVWGFSYLFRAGNQSHRWWKATPPCPTCGSKDWPNRRGAHE